MLQELDIDLSNFYTKTPAERQKYHITQNIEMNTMRLDVLHYLLQKDTEQRRLGRKLYRVKGNKGYIWEQPRVHYMAIF